MSFYLIMVLLTCSCKTENEFRWVPVTVPLTITFRIPYTKKLQQ